MCIRDSNSAILIALAPILRNIAGLGTLEQLLVVDLPDVRRGGQGSGGGGVEHVNGTVSTAAPTSVLIWLMTELDTVLPKFVSGFSYSLRPAVICA